MAATGDSGDMFLYWGSGSAPCWKAMLVLEEKGLPYKDKLISFSEKGHKTEEVMKLNPRGQVPTFQHGDLVVNESGAICFYLEDKFSNQGTKLLPTGIAERAQVYQRLFEASNLERALIHEIVYYHFRTPADKFDKEALVPKYEAARTELERWNGYLKETKAYVAGKDFTMADVFLFPYLAFGVRSKLDLSKYPELKAYYDRVVSRPAVKASWPPHWKDGEGKDMMSAI